MSYGYRVSDKHLGIGDAEVKDGLHVRVDLRPVERPVVGVSLGPHAIGACRPKADPSDGLSQLAGAEKRVCRKPPPISRSRMYAFALFVRAWLRANITPFDPSCDLDFETWLSTTHYSDARKAILRKLHEEDCRNPTDPQVSQVKCFIKDESYGEYKLPRWIMSRTDMFKTMYGPWIKKAEQALYENDAFVKHLDNTERMARIDRLKKSGSKYIETDYTAYESHFVPWIMGICEFALLDHLFKFCPNYDLLRTMNRGVVGAKNHLRASRVLLDVYARMSGEMSTSMGNGFTNLMTMLFVCHENGTEATGIVEGDDGLFTAVGKEPTSDDFKKTGLTIKMNVHDDAADAGFCGLLFDGLAMDAVTDPTKVILNFGWTTRQYKHASPETMLALIRAKALSFLFQYPACPVITAFALRFVFLTACVSFYKLLKVVKAMHLSEYARENVSRALREHPVARPVSIYSRLLMQRKFGLSVQDQLELESWSNGLSLKPFHLPRALEHTVHPDCFDYYRDYVVDYPHVSCPIHHVVDSKLLVKVLDAAEVDPRRIIN